MRCSVSTVRPGPENNAKDLIDIGQKKEFYRFPKIQYNFLIQMVPGWAVSPFRKPLGETKRQDMQEDLRRKVVGSIKHGIPVHVAMAKLDCGGGAGAGGGGTWNSSCELTQRLLFL